MNYNCFIDNLVQKFLNNFMENLLQFLGELQNNNNKPWFDENRKTYENCKKEFLQLIDLIIKDIATFEPDLANLEPKKCIFRINRDIRFSKNKEPYKNNFGAWFALKKGENEMAGYYIHIEPNDKSFVAGGIYMPSNEYLKKIRQEIDYNKKALDDILNDTQYLKYFNGLQGEKLSRPPQGYTADNEAIEYLKLKSFTSTTPLTDEQINSNNLKDSVTERFKALAPLNRFLNVIFEQ